MNSDHLTDNVGRQWVLGPVLGRGTWGRSRVVRDAEGREMVLKEPLTEADFPSDAPLPDDIIEACKSCARQQIDLLEGGSHHYLPRLESTVELGQGRIGLVLPRYSTLERRLDTGVPLGDLLRLVYRIALTLSESQTIHGNLRPSNIVFGERGEAFLADVATRALGPHHARLMDLSGKSSWLPPEARARAGLKPSQAWDTWALCQIIYAVVLSPPPVRSEAERRVEPERRAPRALVDNGLDKVAVTQLKEAVLARLLSEGTNPRFRARVCDRLGALLTRGLSLEHEPSPPYRFATARDFAERVNEVLALLRPKVLEVGKVLFPANTADGIFRHGSEISFSVTVGCTHGITDHDDLVCGLQLVDLDAPDPQSPDARTPVDASLKLQVHPSGRLRFQLTIPEIAPGRFRVRVAFAIKDSGDEPQVAIGDLEVRPPPGYVPPKQEQGPSPLPFRGSPAPAPPAVTKRTPEPRERIPPPAPAAESPRAAAPRDPPSLRTIPPRKSQVSREAPAEEQQPGVVVGLFPRPVRPPEDDLDADEPSARAVSRENLRIVQPDQEEPSEALLSSAPSQQGRASPRNDAPPAAFRPDGASFAAPDTASSRRNAGPPNDAFRAVSLAPVDASSWDASAPARSAQNNEHEHTVPAPGTWPPPAASPHSHAGSAQDDNSLPSDERSSRDLRLKSPSKSPSGPITPLRHARPGRSPLDDDARREARQEGRQERRSSLAPDDLPAAGDELPSISGLPRPQGRLPAPLVALLDLIRSDTYMALVAAVAASLVLLLITTALLKAC